MRFDKISYFGFNNLSLIFSGVVVTSLQITNKELILNQGETAVFECVVKSNTPVRIRWTRGSQVQEVLIYDLVNNKSVVIVS